MASTGEEMSQKMTEVAQEVGERVRSESAAMVNTLTAKSNETIEALSSTNDRLRTEIGELLNRLSQSNATLGTLISAADSTMNDAQNTLLARTENFTTTVAQATSELSESSNLIESNYLGLKEVSATVLVEIAEIAQRFEQQSGALNTVSKLLDETQSNIAVNLDDRRDAIESLTNGLVAKSSDLEELMGRFSTMLTNSVTSAEGRAQSLTQGLAESVGQAAQEATERFSVATSEMRTAANDLRMDLASTRNELKKSVIDLPEETKDSTTAMRRVVSDQIKALKDLQNIVTKTQRLHDAAPSNVTSNTKLSSAPLTRQEPVDPLPQAPRPAVKPPIPVRQKTSPLHETATPTITKTAETPVASAPLRGGLNFTETAPPAVPATSSGSGWVSDLLRRASQEDAGDLTSSTQNSGDSLSTLSADIAKSIDHQSCRGLMATIPIR